MLAISKSWYYNYNINILINRRKKMNSIIYEIFMGRRGNCQNIKITDNYKKLQIEQNKLISALKENLSDKQNMLLEEIFELQADLDSESEFNHYDAGFKLGFRIALECLKD